MPNAQPRLDPARESIDLQRLIDEELYDRDSRWPPRTPAAPETPSGLLDSFWQYLALAMSIPPFPFFRVDAVAPEGRGT
jgi:hypothetical protein